MRSRKGFASRLHRRRKRQADAQLAGADSSLSRRNGLVQPVHFNEPWNGPNNSKLAGQVPPLSVACPSKGKWRGIQRDCTISPLSIRQLHGRMERPARFSSSPTAHRNNHGDRGQWTWPQTGWNLATSSLAEAVELLTTRTRSGHRHFEDGFLTMTYYDTSYRHVAFCDGSVHRLEQHTDAGLARRCYSRGRRSNPPSTQLKICRAENDDDYKMGESVGAECVYRTFVVAGLVVVSVDDEKRTCRGRRASRRGRGMIGVAADAKARLFDFQHSLECHECPARRVVVDFDDVHRRARRQVFQAPAQVRQVDSVHRRAHAHDR